MLTLTKGTDNIKPDAQYDAGSLDIRGRVSCNISRGTKKNWLVI